MNLLQASALISIREGILRGELVPGTQVSVASLQLHVRQPGLPLDSVLTTLIQEGLLGESPTHGYIVRSWSEEEVVDVVEIRGALEGLAARRIAERGASPEFLQELRDCLSDGDAVFSRKFLSLEDKAVYAEMNRRFHALIVEESRSSTLLEALARNSRRPFASPHAIAFGQSDPEQAFDILRYAHRQHYAIIDALENGQGPRADVLMREHVTPVRDGLNMRRQRTSEVPAPAHSESFIAHKRGRAAS